jgi:hypothetical protein
MADVWVCSQCRSLNQGKGRCYKCRVPRAVGGVAPTELPTIGPSAAVAPTGRYRSSAFRAVIASALILALAVLAIVRTVVATLILPSLAQGDTRVAEANLSMLVEQFVLFIGLGVAALVMFAAWLSRVIDNIPPLTGAYPRATPRLTILQVLIPGLNFIWIPSILREALRYLDPRGNGDAIVAAAVLPLIGATLGGAIFSRFVTISTLFGGMSVERAVELQGVFGQVVVGVLAIGAVMLVAVIARVERKSAARAREARTAAA